MSDQPEEIVEEEPVVKINTAAIPFSVGAILAIILLLLAVLMVLSVLPTNPMVVGLLFILTALAILLP